MGEVCAVNSLEQAQLLAAHVNAFVHIYETNIVTSGEFVVVLRHNQYGMENLHSLLPCAGAVLAAVLSCVEDGTCVCVREEEKSSRFVVHEL